MSDKTTLQSNVFPSNIQELDDITLGQFFFNKAEEYADNICQIDGDLDKLETYRSVKERTVRLAINLQKMGISSEDIILICSYNSLDNPIAIIACFYLGAKVVNLDPTLSERNSQYLLTVVKPKLVFVQDEFLPKIETAIKNEGLNSKLIVFGNNEKHTRFSDLLEPSSHEEQFTPLKVDKHDTALMFFSSGTTGMPKAICHSHYGMLFAIDIQRQSLIKVAKCILHYTNFYWISGLGTLILAFADGNTRVFARTAEGAHIFSMIEKYKITSMFLAPIYTYQLTEVVNHKQYNLTSFRALLTGGTSITIPQYKKLLDLFPNSTVLVGYGMTECGIVATFEESDSKQFIQSKITSCGRILPLVEIKIVNPNNEESLGVNQKGEIRIKSPGLMKGYYGKDSSSEFDCCGFLKSGDIGHYDEDKCLYVDGRLKEMFKFRSWHIVPAAIEKVILEHPAVKEAVVFGLPKEEQGEVPAACVVLYENQNVNKIEIEKFVEERVSDVEKLRGGVLIVPNLPTTSTGKLIRNAAKELFIKTML